MNLPRQTVGNAAAIKENARNAGIELRKMFIPCTEGYVDKAKGLKQIVCERGLFPAADLLATGPMRVKDEAIKTKLNTCKDFVTELSQMHFIAKQLGV